MFNMIEIVPTGNDDLWVNYDEYGKTTNVGTELSKRWENKVFYTSPIDPITGETNRCASSLSFLAGSAYSNRNRLILPPLVIIY